MKGYASILSFPFRIYGDAFLPQLEGLADGDLRVRIYRPFLVRNRGSPLSPQVPFPMWTAFQWHPELPREDRLEPPKDPTTTPFGDRAYDALRVDAWGKAAEERAPEFVRRFLRWIRRFTEQAWIDAFESQTDPMVKGSFEIDEQGRALSTPYVYGTFQASDGFRHPMRTQEWQDAFHRALSGQEPETFWLLYLDAVNNQSLQRVNEAILSLALCLEVARDTLFADLADSVDQSDAGTRLGSPFKGDDLRKHLSTHLYAASSRNLQTEMPGLWKSVDDLYIARHKVAHGKRPIVRTSRGVRIAVGQDVGEWSAAVRATIVWMEAVANARAA